MVDARNGPGNKQTSKQKKKEDQIEMFEKIRKKRKTKKIIKVQRGKVKMNLLFPFFLIGNETWSFETLLNIDIEFKVNK